MLAAEAPATPPLEKLTFDTKPKKPHFAPKAKAMISMFMGGGPSHLDMFDRKPKLAEYEGKLYPGDELTIGNFRYQVCGDVIGRPVVMARPVARAAEKS